MKSGSEVVGIVCIRSRRSVFRTTSLIILKRSKIKLEREERRTFWMNDLVMRREELHLRREREEKRGVHLSIS